VQGQTDADGETTLPISIDLPLYPFLESMGGDFLQEEFDYQPDYQSKAEELEWYSREDMVLRLSVDAEFDDKPDFSAGFGNLPVVVPEEPEDAAEK
jgi:hypothetical protein